MGRNLAVGRKSENLPVILQHQVVPAFWNAGVPLQINSAGPGLGLSLPAGGLIGN